MQTVDTPGQHTIAELSAFLTVPSQACLKTLVVHGADGSPGVGGDGDDGAGVGGAGAGGGGADGRA